MQYNPPDPPVNSLHAVKSFVRISHSPATRDLARSSRRKHECGFQVNSLSNNRKKPGRFPSPAIYRKGIAANKPAATGRSHLLTGQGAHLHFEVEKFRLEAVQILPVSDMGENA